MSGQIAVKQDSEISPYLFWIFSHVIDAFSIRKEQ